MKIKNIETNIIIEFKLFVNENCIICSFYSLTT